MAVASASGARFTQVKSALQMELNLPHRNWNVFLQMIQAWESSDMQMLDMHMLKKLPLKKAYTFR
jgi:uncharacterized protein YbaP (TraB family)